MRQKQKVGQRSGVSHGLLTFGQINGSANEATWSFDAAGRISSWANALGTFTPAYANAGYGVSRPSGISFPNGQDANCQWEDKTGDFRLKQIGNTGPSSTALSQFDYVTDALGRITQWKQQRGTDAAERYDLGYNPVDELTSAILKDDSTSAILRSSYYGYDRAGNRTSEQIDSTVTTAAFNELNQMTGIGGSGPTRFKGSLDKKGTVTVNGQPAWMQTTTDFVADVTLSGGTNTVAVVAINTNSVTRTNSYQVVVPTGGTTTLSYDGSGNMTTDGANTYQWDAAGRLVKASYTGGSTEYSYDSLGRRVKIVEKNGGGTVTGTKQFVFDGMAIAEQRDGVNTVTKRYFADGWRDVGGGANYFYTKDHLGSVREVTDDEGAMVARYDYDPYGRTTKLSGSEDSDMLYTGHYHDAGSGLYLTMFRAYSPNLARWISRDPIGENGGINLYAYVSNNPINLWDPYGLYDQWDLLNDVSNFSAGVGDNLSFGLTGLIRESLPGIYGDDGGVDKCSGAYGAGEWTGAGIGFAMGGTGLAKGFANAGSRSLRKELYEIGQKTLTKSKFEYYAARNADPVKRCIDIVRQEGYLRASLPSPSGILTQGWKTVGTGLTPAAAQNIGAAAATGYGFGAGTYGASQ